MKLYRTELDKGISKKLFDIDTNQFQLDELDFYENTINGELSAERSSNGYHISGILNIPFEQTCDRCLTKFHNLRSTEFNFWLTDKNELLQGDSDDILYFSRDDNEIDLKTLFQEIILLEKQMKSICNESCKGLCSSCGTNLNYENCRCSIEESKDDSWEPLKNLIDK
ncbi:DUF177 domain-containing protein [bacterium]|nr:DUF177 domain-containing protein [bacterium]